MARTRTMAPFSSCTTVEHVVNKRSKREKGATKSHGKDQNDGTFFKLHNDRARCEQKIEERSKSPRSPRDGGKKKPMRSYGKDQNDSFFYKASASDAAF